MVELIAKISKGSVMDQIYLPKQRHAFPIGCYVSIHAIKEKEEKRAPIFYGVRSVEPIKVEIIRQIFDIVEDYLDSVNVIVTGSFLEKGFVFSDMDILLVTEEIIKRESIEQEIMQNIGIAPHLLTLSNKELLKGLATDPLYQSMLSKCATSKRMIYSIKPQINYKILDLHLLKSEMIMDNFDLISGKEKYDALRNLVAIVLFMEKKKVQKEDIDQFIEAKFWSIAQIKKNMVPKAKIMAKYKALYRSTKEKIWKGIENESKSQ